MRTNSPAATVTLVSALGWVIYGTFQIQWSKREQNPRLKSLFQYAMTHVRYLNSRGSDADKSPMAPRKRPVQSRSQLTLGALQEAFVRVLITQGYEKMTVREVVSVAGVGIGTFYDYVPNLRTLAASTIHKRCIECGTLLRATVAEHAGQSLETMVKELLETLINLGFSRPREWTALLLLERQVSSAAALRKIHEEFVAIWAAALRASSANLPEPKIIALARMAHALSYGWYSHDLLFYVDDPLHGRSLDEIAHAIVDLGQRASSGLP